MPRITSEESTRKEMIDPQLEKAGWYLRDHSFELQNQMLIVNPHLLIPKLKTHLADYVGRLNDTNNTDLRTKFEARYDFDTRG